MTPGERLQKIRESAGYKGPTEAARAMGANIFTYTQHENGTRQISRNAAVKYANFFRVPLDYLVTGRGTGRSIHRVAVVGYIGAGAEIFPVDDFPQGQGLELVDAPVGISDCVAARVRGDSMYPMLRDGWLVFWRRDQDGVPEECIGRLCVAQIKDGPLLVKDVRKGSRRGVYSLLSVNAPPRDDVQLEWAAPVIDIRPVY